MKTAFDAVMQRIRLPNIKSRLDRDGDQAYELRVMRALMALGMTYEELWHLQSLLRKAEQFQEIRAVLKLYVTSWATLSDIVAILINEVYDLGYDEQDIELGTILRNRHIRGTGLAKVIRKHRHEIDHERYSKLRNDVVHRGKLDDPELEQLNGEWLSKAVLLTYMLDAADDATRQERLTFAAAEMDLPKKRHEFIEKRAASLAAHLTATRALLDDIGDVLSEKLREHAAA